MKAAADDFLKRSGELYDINKNKWKQLLKKQGLKFSEDIYNDSILKTYNAIIKRETDTTDFLSYWCKCFFINSKRETMYLRNKVMDVDISDLLYSMEAEEEKTNEE